MRENIPCNEVSNFMISNYYKITYHVTSRSFEQRERSMRNTVVTYISVICSVSADMCMNLTRCHGAARIIIYKDELDAKPRSL